MLQVTFDLTFDDLLALTVFLRARNAKVLEPAARRDRLAGQMVIVLASGAILLQYITTRLLVDSSAAALGAAIMTVAFSLLLVGSHVLLRMKQKSQLRMLRERGDLGPVPRSVTFTISEDGLRGDTAYSQVVMNWSAIREITEASGWIVFITVGPAVVGAPRRAFATPADADAFLAKAVFWKAAADAVRAPQAVSPQTHAI